MHKVLATGLLAICAIALSQQQASAWINSKFGIGLTWERQSGGNNWGWGAYKNGQPPGPEAYGSAPLQPQAPVFPFYGAPQMHHSSFDAPMIDAGYYAQPVPQFAPTGPQFPAQFATYPRPVYYYYGR